jgi:hypothetical protein
LFEQFVVTVGKHSCDARRARDDSNRPSSRRRNCSAHTALFRTTKQHPLTANRIPRPSTHAGSGLQPSRPRPSPLKQLRAASSSVNVPATFGERSPEDYESCELGKRHIERGAVTDVDPGKHRIGLSRCDSSVMRLPAYVSLSAFSATSDCLSHQARNRRNRARNWTTSWRSASCRKGLPLFSLLFEPAPFL